MKKFLKLLGIICLILAVPCGLLGWFAYGFWTSGMNPTAVRFLRAFGIFLLAGFLLLATSASQSGEK